MKTYQNSIRLFFSPFGPLGLLLFLILSSSSNTYSAFIPVNAKSPPSHPIVAPTKNYNNNFLTPRGGGGGGGRRMPLPLLPLLPQLLLAPVRNNNNPKRNNNSDNATTTTTRLQSTAASDEDVSTTTNNSNTSSIIENETTDDTTSTTPMDDVTISTNGDVGAAVPSNTTTNELVTIEQGNDNDDDDEVNEAAWMSGLKNSLASALAAACSKLLLAPFDTIKTMQQHSRTTMDMKPLTLIQAAQTILQRPKGFLELYSGIGVAVAGGMPSVGMYFGIYSFCKKTFHQLDPDARNGRQLFYIALSAAIGNAISSASRVPYEVVKQKLQTQVYANVGEALKDLSWTALFPSGGIASQMLRDIPYAIVTLLTYEHLKHKWKPRAEKAMPQIPMRTWDLLVGGTAGGVGSYVTNPMDVIKTRLQTSSALYGGSIKECAWLTWQEGGPMAFLRGSIPRLLHKVPANAFFFLFYEFFRTLLRVHDDTTTTKPKPKPTTTAAAAAPPPPPPPPPTTTTTEATTDENQDESSSASVDSKTQ